MKPFERIIRLFFLFTFLKSNLRGILICGCPLIYYVSCDYSQENLKQHIDLNKYKTISSADKCSALTFVLIWEVEDTIVV